MRVNICDAKGSELSTYMSDVGKHIFLPLNGDYSWPDSRAYKHDTNREGKEADESKREESRERDTWRKREN